MQKAPPTPKGFRDILPEKAAKRKSAINTISDVLEKEGFQPLETPTIEFSETLTGKYGEEEKLIYKFTDRGDRELALRYDLTVPLARFVANNQNLLTPTFSRYQIGQVFRGENPQHGRYREFTQFDFDTVGSTDLEEDAKIIASAIRSVKKIGLKGYRMKINHKDYLINTLIPASGISTNTVSSTLIEIDKLDKKPRAEVDRSIVNLGNTYVSAATVSGTITPQDLQNFDTTFRKLEDSFQGFKPTHSDIPVFSQEEIKKEYASHHPNPDIYSEPETYKKLKIILFKMGINPEDIEFDSHLVRGLNYYTGFIFELKPSDTVGNAIGAGGRYDNLIGMFAGRQIPAVGFSFGLDRIVDLL